MPKFKGVVQVYSEYVVEAKDVENAKALIQEEALKEFGAKRMNINEPKNLDKVEKPKGKKKNG